MMAGMCSEGSKMGLAVWVEGGTSVDAILGTTSYRAWDMSR